MEEELVPLLLVAVVHQQDAERIVDGLGTAGHRVTRLVSVGGFLGTENSTLLVAIDDAQEAEVLGIFERACSDRDVEVPLVLLGRLKDEFPRSVHYGGATIFVVELRSIIHIRTEEAPAGRA
jgi:uncharacterized protein YaaQ